jgi:hypothetical protein
MTEDKKSKQLGMSASKAHAKLGKDILYHFVLTTGKNTCYRCGKPMSRETFSIEHKEDWLDSQDPVKLFFSMDNISFSHKVCNYAASRSRLPSKCGTTNAYAKGCRCDECIAAYKAMYARKKKRTPEQRQAQYERTGK